MLKKKRRKLRRKLRRRWPHRKDMADTDKPLFINEKSEKFIRCWECKCETNDTHVVVKNRILCLHCATH